MSTLDNLTAAYFLGLFSCLSLANAKVLMVSKNKMPIIQLINWGCASRLAQYIRGSLHNQRIEVNNRVLPSKEIDKVLYNLLGSSSLMNLK